MKTRPRKGGAFCGIFIDDKLLLGWKLAGGEVPVWELPGGGIEPGEKPEEAAIREVMEETHLKVSDLKLIGIKNERLHWNNDEKVYFFIAGKAEGIPIADDDLKKTRLFSIEELKNTENLSWHVIDFLYFYSKINEKYRDVYESVKKCDNRPLLDNPEKYYVFIE